jgi:voltage-gated potassium channel
MKKDGLSARELCRLIIFEADTPAGKAFDVALIVSIATSVLAVCLDSVPYLHDRFQGTFNLIEWTFTILFTIEYFLRLWSVRSPAYYARSFYGIVDLAAILPTYLSLFYTGAEFLVVVRLLRVLRIFRILKLVQYLEGSRTIMRALRASKPKIVVFVSTIVVLVTIIGSLMYLIEGEAGGFTSIPMGIYWAIVTLTTVGYGDLAPNTPLGKLLASIVMIMGYGIIAVPTGIVTAELTRQETSTTTRSCPNCSAEGHLDIAEHCYRCGHALELPPEDTEV